MRIYTTAHTICIWHTLKNCIFWQFHISGVNKSLEEKIHLCKCRHYFSPVFHCFARLTNGNKKQEARNEHVSGKYIGRSHTGASPYTLNITFFFLFNKKLYVVKVSNLHIFHLSGLWGLPSIFTFVFQSGHSRRTALPGSICPCVFQGSDSPRPPVAVARRTIPGRGDQHVQPRQQHLTEAVTAGRSIFYHCIFAPGCCSGQLHVWNHWQQRTEQTLILPQESKLEWVFTLRTWHSSAFRWFSAHFWSILFHFLILWLHCT